MLVAILTGTLAFMGSARAEVTSGAAFPDAHVRAWQTGTLRADRLQHFSLSLTSGLMVGLVTEEPIAAVSSALAFGLVKELWDARRGRFDAMDLLADTIGAGTAAATTITLSR